MWMTDGIKNPTVKAAIEALQRGDSAAWLKLFEPDAVLYDDGSPRSVEKFAQDALGHERFVSIDRIEKEGLNLFGAYHSDAWGDFHSYFKFELGPAGKIKRLDMGQASWAG